MDENNEWNWIKAWVMKGNEPYDFWKGFGLGFLILLGVPLFAYIGLQTDIPFLDGINAVIPFLVYLVAIIVFLCVGRWKFALGLISVLLIPVAIFGGCLLLIGL